MHMLTILAISGQDYNDARVRDFEDGMCILTYCMRIQTCLHVMFIVENWDRRLIDKTTTPRMPWHDVSLCMVSVCEMLRNKGNSAFVEHWVSFLVGWSGSRCEQTFL